METSISDSPAYFSVVYLMIQLTLYIPSVPASSRFFACSVSFFMANSFLFLKLGKPFLHLRHHLGIFLQL